MVNWDSRQLYYRRDGGDAPHHRHSGRNGPTAPAAGIPHKIKEQKRRPLDRGRLFRLEFPYYCFLNCAGVLYASGWRNFFIAFSFSAQDSLMNTTFPPFWYWPRSW